MNDHRILVDSIHDSATIIHKGKTMNERIRELYYDCQDESQSTEQCYQKFAELIIRECMIICKQHPSRTLSNNWDADAVAPDIVHRFEQHFGVEE